MFYSCKTYLIIRLKTLIIGSFKGTIPAIFLNNSLLSEINKEYLNKSAKLNHYY